MQISILLLTLLLSFVWAIRHPTNGIVAKYKDDPKVDWDKYNRFNQAVPPTVVIKYALVITILVHILFK